MSAIAQASRSSQPAPRPAASDAAFNEFLASFLEPVESGDAEEDGAFIKDEEEFDETDADDTAPAQQTENGD